MPDPTPYPPPQMLITLAPGGKFRIEIAGEDDVMELKSINGLSVAVRYWAKSAKTVRAEVVS